MSLKADYKHTKKQFKAKQADPNSKTEELAMLKMEKNMMRRMVKDAEK